MSMLSTLRRLLRDDHKRAVAAERDILASDQARRSRVDDELAHAFCDDGDDAIELGTMVRQRRSLRLSPARLRCHILLVGPSGCGKTRTLCLLVMGLIRAGVRNVIVFDVKAETVGLIKQALVNYVATLPAAEAKALLARTVSLDPFATRGVLPRLQLLAADGIDEELHAHAVGAQITKGLDMVAGFRQEADITAAIRALIVLGWPAPALARVIDEPRLLEIMAERTNNRIVRLAAARLHRESPERLAGIAARIDKLLRLKSLRLSLCAPDCSVDRVLEGCLALSNLESPDGSGDGLAVCPLLFARIAAAIRRRPNGGEPVYIVIEEWPLWLAAGGAHASAAIESLLRISRSKNCFFVLASQDIGASISRINAALPSVVKENVPLHIVFRTEDDYAAYLPVTGRRRRTPSAPWEEQSKRVYLEPNEERALLKEELTRLPNRRAYVLDRRLGQPAVLMDTADCPITVREEDLAWLDEQTANHPAVMRVAELEAAEARMHAELDEVLGGAPACPDPQPLLRRRKGPVEIG